MDKEVIELSKLDEIQELLKLSAMLDACLMICRSDNYYDEIVPIRDRVDDKLEELKSVTHLVDYRLL